MEETLKANVLIVGGTGGIGRALAERYAKLGSDVIITSRDAGRASAAAAEIGPNVRGIALDIAEPEKIAAMLADIGVIDRLLIVAVERDHNSVRNYDIAKARRGVTVKLVGYTEIVHTMLDRFSDDASVVIFGGLAADRPYPGSTTITMVNGAVKSMIKTMAVELAPIRFNAIHPGIIGDTPAWADKPEALEVVRARTPGGRLATTEDVVDAVKFLFNNRGVNGVNLVVDGGWTLQ
ncbi:MAG TPA: SDR family oxidoreductase [Gammaproteobacteria bacterium]|nr:SDR family oxidoreductase [Gammaproteobacteria bacterium]